MKLLLQKQIYLTLYYLLIQASSATTITQRRLSQSTFLNCLIKEAAAVPSILVHAVCRIISPRFSWHCWYLLEVIKGTLSADMYSSVVEKPMPVEIQSNVAAVAAVFISTDWLRLSYRFKLYSKLYILHMKKELLRPFLFSLTISMSSIVQSKGGCLANIFICLKKFNKLIYLLRLLTTERWINWLLKN